MAIATGTAILGAAALGAGASYVNSQNQAEAIGDAADVQAQAGQDAIAAQQEAEALQRADLQPFTEFGLGFIPQTEQAYNQSASLFAPNALDNVLQSDAFGTLNSAANERLLRIQAGGGRVNSSETRPLLTESSANIGLGILGQQQNAALANRNSLLQALGIGQSSAAGQGAAAIQTGANVGNTLTGIGNTQAAGLIGVANANAQGLQNIAGFGGMALGAGFNPFAQQAGTNPFNMQGYVPTSATNFGGP